MSAVSKPVLYSYWLSSCSWRVRIALNLKQISYDISPIHLQKGSGEHHTDKFRKINPMQRVPALHIDNITLIESMNIMSYLEETRPHNPLMPKDLVQRARVREVCEIIVSGIQPLQNVGVLDHVGNERRLEWAQMWINKGFAAVEKLLLSSAGKYCFGDEITLADCCLVPQVYNARRYHVNVESYPTIFEVDRNLKDHPAFVASHPRNQPDSERKAAK